MEHADALERIEIAAAEPDGLDRLMAGDTAEAASIAGHLAGCPDCTAELARIRRASAIARDVIGAAPDPSLRARTLAYVQAAGVPRGTGAAVRPAGAPEPGAATPGAAAPITIDSLRERRTMTRLRLAVAGLAAALVITLGGGALLYRNAASTADAAIARQSDEVAILEATSRATLRVTAQPDARRVALAATSTGPAAALGTLLFSPSTGELVAVATDLVPEAAGQEYGCWVEVDGVRTRLGKMYWAGDLWTWAGPVGGLRDLPAGATFGVSLGPVGGGTESTPVLAGSL
ncbi:MAG TPA: hypothetical protein VGK16_02640 [Candidatus Limnocylindrales bacterium]